MKMETRAIWRFVGRQTPYLKLELHPRLEAYFSTVHGLGFLQEIGLNTNRAIVRQVHGNRVIPVEGPLEGAVEADGMVTDQPGLFLVVRVADCYPVYLLDPHRGVVGLLHAGWRGVHGKIHLEALRVMEARFQTRPEDLWVALGPGICGGCYEVGEEFLELFPGHVEKRGHRYFLDLQRVMSLELIEAGVPATQIHLAPYCTFENPLFHSYRRGRKGRGRNWAIAALG